VGSPAKRIYEFGSFRLDPDERLLWRAGVVLPLTSKLFDTLLLLVENRGHLLSKDELMKRLWPACFVDEVNISQNISRLRKILEDTEGQRFISTVVGHGYRFVADVRCETVEEAVDEAAAVDRPPSGVWWLHADGIHARLREGENGVGREQPTDVWLDSGSVSRRHARITIDGPTIWLEDLGSTNGTTVNGHRVAARVRLEDGDEVGFGKVLMQVRWVRAAASTEPLGPAAG
jgi:DNA-binding winged helix-turn-helix (wHTH) protein